MKEEWKGLSRSHSLSSFLSFSEELYCLLVSSFFSGSLDVLHTMVIRFSHTLPVEQYSNTEEKEGYSFTLFKIQFIHIRITGRTGLKSYDLY